MGQGGLHMHSVLSSHCFSLLTILFYCLLTPLSFLTSLPPPVFRSLASSSLLPFAVFGMLPCSCQREVTADRWLDIKGQGYETLGIMKQDGPPYIIKTQGYVSLLTFVSLGQADREHSLSLN